MKFALGLCLSCSTSPRTSPPEATSKPISAQPQTPPAASAAPHPEVALPASSQNPANAPPLGDIASPPRVSIGPSIDAWYLVDFPTSISERADRIAALVSIDDGCNSRCLQWFVIKRVDADKIEQTIALVDAEFGSKIGQTCPDDTWSTCPQRPELERRVEAANAVLARDNWRRIPCYRGFRPDRIEAGCEQFLDLDVSFTSPRLIVSQRGRVLLNRSVPTWIYRDASCKDVAMTDIESYALDPETGTLVVGLQFWAGYEGCSVPRWDFHPIRMPTLRRKALPDRDGGAP